MLCGRPNHYKSYSSGHWHQRQPATFERPTLGASKAGVRRRRRSDRRAYRNRMVKPQPHGARNVQMRASDSLVGQLPRFHRRHHGAGSASVGAGLRTAHPCRLELPCTATAPSIATSDRVTTLSSLGSTGDTGRKARWRERKHRRPGHHHRNPVERPGRQPVIRLGARPGR